MTQPIPGPYDLSEDDFKRVQAIAHQLVNELQRTTTAREASTIAVAATQLLAALIATAAGCETDKYICVAGQYFTFASGTMKAVKQQGQS
jgi:hypothetical protein